MKTQKTARLHRFHDLVALSFPDTEQLYLTAETALRLSTELRRFAKSVDQSQWPATRVVREETDDSPAVAVTESTESKKVQYI
jgi:hypothetical protein